MVQRFFSILGCIFLLTSPLESWAADSKWTSVVLNVHCDSKDTSEYCEIRKFEYFPDGSFIFNGSERGTLARWRQRQIETPASYIAEHDADKEIVCIYQEDSSRFYESVMLKLADGREKIVFVRFKDGRCSTASEASLFKPLSEGAINRGKIGH